MKYCKKCGAELPDGASFCEKCGNPIQGTAKKSKKKKLIVCGCVGVIVLAIAVTGVLYATGMIGGKGEAVQADVDTVVPTEMPSVTEEAIGGTEADSQAEQKTDVSDARDKAWEAYVAYKAYLGGQQDKEREDEEYTDEDDGQTQFSLIYLDEDEYPELIVFRTQATVDNHFLYTYKNGAVVDTEFTATDILYKERQDYIFDYSRYTLGTTHDIVQVLKGEDMETVYENLYELEVEKSMEDSDYNIEEHFDSPEKVADKCGVAGGWDEPVYGANIDEAYTQFLSAENR